MSGSATPAMQNRPSRVCCQVPKQIAQRSAKVDGCLGCNIVHISCVQSHCEIGIRKHCLSALHVIQQSFHRCIKHADVGFANSIPPNLQVFQRKPWAAEDKSSLQSQTAQIQGPFFYQFPEPF